MFEEVNPTESVKEPVHEVLFESEVEDTEDVNLAESEVETIEDLSPADKATDPLSGARIRRLVDGSWLTGKVVDIEQGKVTKERLYLTRFQDDDREHLTAEQVKASRMYSDGEEESALSQ